MLYCVFFLAFSVTSVQAAEQEDKWSLLNMSAPVQYLHLDGHRSRDLIISSVESLSGPVSGLSQTILADLSYDPRVTQSMYFENYRAVEFIDQTGHFFSALSFGDGGDCYKIKFAFAQRKKPGVVALRFRADENSVNISIFTIRYNQYFNRGFSPIYYQEYKEVNYVGRLCTGDEIDRKLVELLNSLPSNEL